MNTLHHISPPFRVHYGDASLERLPDELERLGCRRAVVFCGETIAHRSAALSLVSETLGSRCAGVFDGVKAHSPLPAVLSGVEALKGMQADAVIAVGGGSAVVTARASTILLAEARDLREICTQYTAGKPPVSPKLVKPKLPQLVVPTTPTTAYAKAGTAVLDPVLGTRATLFDPKTRAHAIFIHPALAATAPSSLALDAGAQAYAMAVQGLESRNRNPFADAALIHALRLLGRYLVKLVEDPGDAETRGQLMIGAFLSGHGTDYAPTGLTSALAHCIGARCHLPNGVTNALVLPHAIRFNAPATGERLLLVAELLGADVRGTRACGEAAASATERFFAQLGLPGRLRDAGVPQDALARIAEDAFGDWFLHQNPRRVSNAGELLEVLDAAW